MPLSGSEKILRLLFGADTVLAVCEGVTSGDTKGEEVCEKAVYNPTIARLNTAPIIFLERIVSPVYVKKSLIY